MPVHSTFFSKAEHCWEVRVRRRQGKLEISADWPCCECFSTPAEHLAPFNNLITWSFPSAGSYSNPHSAPQTFFTTLLHFWSKIPAILTIHFLALPSNLGGRDVLSAQAPLKLLPLLVNSFLLFLFFNLSFPSVYQHTQASPLRRKSCFPHFISNFLKEDLSSSY